MNTSGKSDGNSPTLSFNLPAAADRASLFQDLAGFGLDRSAAEPYAVEFDEAHYLSIYPDAQRLISCGDFKSAEDHWLQCGRYKYNEFRYRLLPNTDFSIHTEFMNSKPVTTFGLIASFSALNRKHWKPFLLSILRQSYPNWSVIALCAGDVSCKAELAAIVAELGLSELVVLRKIGDLSLSDILKTTTADFLAFMDPVNFITPDGLYRCAQFVQSAATMPAFYTDEVLVRPDGKIEGFFHKPKWSPQFFCSQGYCCGLTFFERLNLLRMTEVLSGPISGIAEFQLTLKYVEAGISLGHVQYPCFARRSLADGDVSLLSQAEQNAKNAAELMLDMRRSLGLRSCPAAQNGGAVRFGAAVIERTANTRVSIVIPTADSKARIGGREISLLDSCLAQLRRTTADIAPEIVVIRNDDMSPARCARLEQMGATVVLFKGEFNFSRKVNVGVARAKYDRILLINDDVFPVATGWLECMLGSLATSRVGVVGAKLLYPDGRLQHGGAGLFRGLPYHLQHGKEARYPSYAGFTDAVREVSAVTGACMLTQRDLLQAIGGWDEDFPDLFNDIDFCLRLRRSGHRVIYDGRAALLHLESASLDPARGHDSEARLRFTKKWGTDWSLDPYYNPAISEYQPYRWRHRPEVASRWKDTMPEFLSSLDIELVTA